ncbi:amidohydrolase family protein [Brumimicrobium oceani]|uniref:Amidohydrolase n=1 Tax=Brumimicrobium oceani TaxID=2100725 RepID=A0A2U2X572_9FLAO|nr:amidohydrolase family protein [Brumimicrobium oceani]PWH82938.1 amidohydrolase [Brumimicrobium oceani]
MKTIYFLSFLLLFTVTFSFGQIPVPNNGMKKSEPSTYVLRNAKIIVSPEKIIKKGSLVIKDGKVISVGKLVRFPDGAIVMDMEGKTIVPSFIESYSSVGLPKAEVSKNAEDPQIETSKEGAYYWNESIHPEVNAANEFKVDKKASETLQKMGFSVAATHIDDGIARGNGALVALGDIPYKKAILKANGAAYFSLEKGVSRQTYPSSQMGVIALLRQALYDAEYYKNHEESIAANLSLAALNKQLSGPIIFSVNDKLEVLRVQKIAEEFGLEFVIVGGGNEFEQIHDFKDWKQPMILPINFSAAYDVGDPYISQQIPLGDLKEWELAPSNPYLLKKNNVQFAISSKGHTKAEDFWKHFHSVLERGLSREDALAALTTIPAEIFNMEDQLGTLDEGKIASFSVFDKDPFEMKNAILEESWSIGKQHLISNTPEIDIRGKYRISLPETSYVVDIKGSAEKPTGTAVSYKKITDSSTMKTRVDTLTSKVGVKVDYRDAVFYFEIKDNKYEGVITLHGNFSPKIDAFIGNAQLPDGTWAKWSGIQLSGYKVDPEDLEKNKVKVDTNSVGKVWFPNMAYGLDSLPETKTYVIRNATIWTNEAKGVIKNASIVLKNGKIDFVGTGTFSIPANAIEIDGNGMHVTSGIIDEHSHIAISKGVNESGQAISAEASIADVVRNDDINIYRQLSGGVTVSQLLHGSANPIGGQSAIIKLKWGYSPEEMLVKDMPKFIKFALGENVKQSNWGTHQTVRFPQTRMGVEQVFYDAFIRAEEYKKKWEEYNALSTKKAERLNILPPAKDLELETVWEVKNGERFISCHSYVQSEINMLMKVADSMGFTVNTFTHILEGYKLADKMAQHGAGGSTFSDWWAYKYEVKDAIPFNANLMQEQGVVVAINSDDAEMGRRLNQEAAKSIKYGGMSEEDAWKMVTLNPAKLLHLDERMGSLKKGKDADVVIWSDNPLSINAQVVKTFVDGELLYDSYKSVDHFYRIQTEKARIITKMLSENQNGEAKKPFVKKKEKHWHCDSIGDSKH